MADRITARISQLFAECIGDSRVRPARTNPSPTDKVSANRCRATKPCFFLPPTPEKNAILSEISRARDQELKIKFSSFNHRHRFLPQSSSRSRMTAGAAGFLTLIQLSVRPET